MKPLLYSTLGVGGLLLGVALPIQTITAECTRFHTETVYDTPSGKLDTGYYLDGTIPPPITNYVSATSSYRSPTSYTPAHKIGLRAFADCEVGGKTKSVEITKTKHDTAIVSRQIFKKDISQSLLDSI